MEMVAVLRIFVREVEGGKLHQRMIMTLLKGNLTHTQDARYIAEGHFETKFRQWRGIRVEDDATRSMRRRVSLADFYGDNSSRLRFAVSIPIVAKTTAPIQATMPNIAKTV